jgi:hypothetical protein
MMITLELQDSNLNIKIDLISYCISLTGRGTIICGTFMPWDAKKCDTYHCFSELNFINLHCDDNTRNARLRNREDKEIWTDEMLKSHEQFAQWLLDNAETAYDPPMHTIDTTINTPKEVAEQIIEYILFKWDDRLVKR